MLSNFQHSGDDMILPDGLKAQVSPLIDQYWDMRKSGAVGYIAGLPTMAQMLQWKDTDNSMSLLRSTAEAKGATVTWNGDDRSITVTKGANTLFVKLGAATATVNGQEVKLSMPAKLDNDRTVFPTATLANFLNQ